MMAISHKHHQMTFGHRRLSQPMGFARGPLPFSMRVFRIKAKNVRYMYALLERRYPANEMIKRMSLVVSLGNAFQAQ